MNFAHVIHRCFSKDAAYRNRSRRKRTIDPLMHLFSSAPVLGVATLLLLVSGGQARGDGFPTNPYQPGPVYQQPTGPAEQQSGGAAWQPTPFQTTTYAPGNHPPAPHHQHAPQRHAPHQHAPHQHSPHQHAPHQHAPHGQSVFEHGPDEHAPFSHAPHQPRWYQPGAYQPDLCEPELCAPVPCRPSGIYGGFEFLWMRAHFDQNVAMIIDPLPGNTAVPFDYAFELTPRTWIGWQGPNHHGFRATYWRFDERANTESATAVDGGTPIFLFVNGAGGNLTRNAFAELGDTFTSTHRLELEALDLELTERFQLSSFQVLAGAGLRLARMEQDMRAEVFTAAGVLEEVVTNDLRFEGVGPTVSLQLRRPLGASRFSVYSGMRGSLLFGETRQTIFEMKGAGDNIVADVADHREVLSVGELALGLEYARPVGTHAQWFIRSGYEVQVWRDAGGPVDSDSTVSLDGITLATGFLY